MTIPTVLILRPVRKLIPLLPDTDLSRLLSEALALAQAFPGLLDRIERDLDAHGLAKKTERLEDKAWLAAQGKALPGFDVGIDEDWLDELELGIGRPRMPAILVLMFIVLRGWLGGFKDRKVVMLLLESKTIEICLASLGFRLPGASAIIDNTNAVSLETREAILDAQASTVRMEGLDDFQKQTFDSTKVEANSAWPTDSGLILALSERAIHVLGLLAEYGIRIRLPAVVKALVKTAAELNKQIQLSSGKKAGAKKRGKLYRKLLRLARKVARELRGAHERAAAKVGAVDVMPSEKRNLTKLIDWIGSDVVDLGRTIINADKRINQGKKVPVAEKVLSVADDDAAMIVKGERTPVVGYKPQIGRSEKGFVTAIIVPEGNAADSGQLRPIVDAAIQRTGVVPSVLSFDDGYTNTEDREFYLALGIDVVSFSGAKGRHITPTDEYDSDPYRQARNDRSAVESLMYTLKHNHGFGQLMRRGIESVRAELLEKAIAYNFFRMVKLRPEHLARRAAA